MEDFMQIKYPNQETLKTHYCEDDTAFVYAANAWLRGVKVKHSAKSLYLPAGETPKSLYKDWTDSATELLDGLELYQIDEVLSERQPKMFENFFAEHLQVPGAQVISPGESKGKQADLAILGLGKNGHLAFHEPGITKEFFYGEVELEKVTKQHLQLERDAKGLTYGLQAFLKAKAVLLLVKGEGKQDVYTHFLENRGSATVNGLREHPDLTVVAMSSFKAQH